MANNADKPTSQFWEHCLNQFPLANKNYAGNAEAIAPLLTHADVVVTGHVSEIAKNFYTRRLQSLGRVTPEALALVTGMDRQPFAVAAYAE